MISMHGFPGALHYTAVNYVYRFAVSGELIIRAVQR